MDGNATIGVLSTSFGGPYFGGLLGGISRAAAAAGGRLIAIQTLDAGTSSLDVKEPPEFGHEVGWDHISGFVVILNAVNQRYLAAVRAAGKPIVMISHEYADFACPVVLPDNRTGVAEAVAHLIEHGHRRIAFAGSPQQKDVSQRYRSYRDTLAAHGIEPDPRLFFETGNLQETGGEAAAHAMLAAGLPSTAVVTGNDLNAIGLMRVLTAAGHELPRDQAVVGFDDMDPAVYLTPSLATVEQRFDVTAGLATALLLRQLAGEDVAYRQHLLPTTFVPRESCGCPSTLSLGTDWTRPPPLISSPAELADRLDAVLGTGRDAGDSAESAVSAGVAGIVAAVRAADRAADRGVGGDPAAFQRALTGLYRLRPHPERLVETMRCIRQYGRHVTVELLDRGEVAAALRVEDCVQETIVALFQTHARAHFRNSTDFQATFNAQYEVSMDLLRSHEEDPRSLGWLASTDVRAGCLGLWSAGRTGAAGPDTLDIVGMLAHARGQQPPLPAQPTPVAAFPPAELVELADSAAEDMVFVAPVKVNTSDRGMLAFVGPIDSARPTGRDTMNQWAALLTIALDHEAVLGSLRDQEERLRRAALYDELTGLANRTLFVGRLEQAMQRAKRRPDEHFAVLLLDLDGFKVVNDSLGHLAGDQLLVRMAERIVANLREVDVAARFGGDEFAILLDGVGDTQDPEAVADRLHAALSAPYLLDDQEVVVSASIGIALSATGYENPQDVIRDADIAMYSAKSSEKGSHALFDVAMHVRAVGRLRTEAELRRAVDRGELEVHYQPIVHLPTGRLAAFEALVRWRHPVRGLLGPAEFLPVAEESGLVLPISRWVLAEACRQAAGWHAAVPEAQPVRMSVNVSNRQFWHGRLAPDVADLLATAGLEPAHLSLELTEGVIMHDVRLARTMLEELHETGVELHIDDFGTGYSSLEALHRLPIDVLKIDRSFVAQLGTDPKSGELVRSILLMGGNLGLELVAEGIETVLQRDHLRELGCGYGQGYWFSKPVPADAAEVLIRYPAPIWSPAPVAVATAS